MLSAILSMINDETDKELVRSLYEANEQLMYNVAYKIGSSLESVGRKEQKL